MKKTVTSLLLSVSLGAAASAAEQATTDDAHALALKAAAYVEEHGVEDAANAFAVKGSEWLAKDMYVIVQEKGTGITLANGAKPSFIGKSLLGLKDPDGKPFAKMIGEIEGEGWVDYKWPSPATGLITEKSTFCKQVENMLVCVGAYK